MFLSEFCVRGAPSAAAHRHRRFLFDGLFAALFLIPAVCAGQDLADAPVKKLVITRAMEPSPALKYRLTPRLGELRPGNAALLYQRAHSPEWFGSLRRFPDFDKLHEYLEQPLEKMPRDKLEAFVMRGMLNEIDMAARRLHCDWEMLDRIRDEGFGLLIPDVQSFRTYGVLLERETRVHLLDRDFEKAVRSMQTNVTLARHVSEAPILINVLVGNAILNIGLNDLEEMARIDDSPSMFWALADLPQPFLHMERALEGERLMIEVVLPGIREALKDPKRPPLSVPQLQAGLEQVSPLFGDSGSSVLGRGGQVNTKLALAYLTSRTYPKAREYLLKQGFTAEQLEAMSVTQVSLMYSMVEYDRLFDDFAKWYRQPRWMARAGMRKGYESLLKARADQPEAWLATLILPAVDKVHEAQTRVERRLAFLQHIEALRLYAGKHDGQLPASLADIKDLPLPLDPATGNPFQYSLADGKALLVAPHPPGGMANPTMSLRYEITVKK